MEIEQEQDKSHIIKYEEGSAELIPISDVSTQKNILSAAISLSFLSSNW